MLKKKTINHPIFKGGNDLELIASFGNSRTKFCQGTNFRNRNVNSQKIQMGKSIKKRKISQ